MDVFPYHIWQNEDVLFFTREVCGEGIRYTVYGIQTRARADINKRILCSRLWDVIRQSCLTVSRRIRIEHEIVSELLAVILNECNEFS